MHDPKERFALLFPSSFASWLPWSEQPPPSHASTMLPCLSMHPQAVEPSANGKKPRRLENEPFLFLTILFQVFCYGIKNLYLWPLVPFDSEMFFHCEIDDGPRRKVELQYRRNLNSWTTPLKVTCFPRTSAKELVWVRNKHLVHETIETGGLTC